MTTQTMNPPNASIAPEEPYQTVCVPKSDIAVILEALKTFYKIAHNDKAPAAQLQRISDVFDFFNRIPQ